MTTRVTSPAEIRGRVLEQHKTIRDRIARVEGRAFEASSGTDTDKLASDFEGLLSLLQTHMRFEDQVLPEVLRDADAWGEERVSRFHAEHAQQRTMIQHLLEAHRQRDDFERVLLALGFCALLRKDMEAEESVFLDEDVLRDDPIAISPEPE